MRVLEQMRRLSIDLERLVGETIEVERIRVPTQLYNERLRSGRDLDLSSDPCAPGDEHTEIQIGPAGKKLLPLSVV